MSIFWERLSEARQKENNKNIFDSLCNSHYGFCLAPGFTCCQAPLGNNVVSELSQRIDLILPIGPVEVQNIALFGADAASKTAEGLWSSDHPGVAAQVVIEKA
jgi:hypothetical protein